FGAIAAYLFWMRRKPALDPVLQLYLDFTNVMADRGFSREPAEGPLDYCRRIAAPIAATQPSLAQEVQGITNAFIRLLYAGSSVQASDIQTLRSRIRRLSTL